MYMMQKLYFFIQKTCAFQQQKSSHQPKNSRSFIIAIPNWSFEVFPNKKYTSAFFTHFENQCWLGNKFNSAFRYEGTRVRGRQQGKGPYIPEK